jgi:hypothetical protein
MDDKLRNLCSEIMQHDGKSISYIILRQAEKFTSVAEIMSCIKPRCVVFVDEERIDVPPDELNKVGIHGRKKAWKRKYHLEGYDKELKAHTLNYITKAEFDGIDYIEINLRIDDRNITKIISPDGSFALAEVTPDFRTTVYRGHISSTKMELAFRG